MKKINFPMLLAAALGILLVCWGLAGILGRYGHFSLMLPVPHKNAPTVNGSSLNPTRLSAKGNQLVDANAAAVVLKGLMPPDPARLSSEGRFNQAYFMGMAKTGANVIRIPVHPENWVSDPDYLWRYLAPIVSWAGAAGMYVIIDWHYIGNVATGAGPQMPILNTKPMDLTLQFWRQTALYFKDTPNVIFELFNEPQSITANDWRASAQQILAEVRSQGAAQLVIVGGIDYGKDLSWVSRNALDDANLAYASHIYPAHAMSLWRTWFGTTAEKYPVLITEWGFMSSSSDPSQLYLVGSAAAYGEPLLQYLDARHIGWVACWYDDEWLPPMFTAGMQGTTAYGDFIIKELGK